MCDICMNEMSKYRASQMMTLEVESYFVFQGGRLKIKMAVLFKLIYSVMGSYPNANSIT